MKKLILNADDYGATNFIDNGIIEGIKAGVINSVSVLVNHQDFNSRVTDKLLPLAEEYGVEIGLHLSITTGFVEGGRNHATNSLTYSKTSKFILLADLILNRISRDELKAEIKYQIEKLGRALRGVENIEHINSHQGIFYFDRYLLNCLLEVLDEYKSQGKIFYLRSPFTWSRKLPYNDYDRKFSISIRRQAFRNALKRGFLRKRGRCNTVKRLFVGTFRNKINEVNRRLLEYNNKIPYCFIDHWYGQAYKHNLKAIVNNLPEDGDKVVEFMLHVGHGDEYDEASGINSGYYHHRKMELEILIENKHLLEEVAIVNYSPNTW